MLSKKFNIFWLKLSCFLIGWDYSMVRNCSELSKRDAKRYCSALLLISVIWFFVGFAFSNRYLSLGIPGSLAGGLISIICIIQIERQIIMSSRNKVLAIFRIFLALIMSAIGAILIDQYVFRNDIEGMLNESRRDRIEAKIKDRNNELEERLSGLNVELTKLDATIKDQQQKFTDELFGTGKSTGTLGYGSIAKGQESFLKSSIDQREKIRQEISNVQDNKLRIRDQIEKDVMNAPRGFLEEFRILLALIRTDGWSLMVYIIFVSFFLCIETIIVVTKYLHKTKNDYENIVDFQLEVRFKQLQNLEMDTIRKMGRSQLIDSSNSLASRVI